MYNSLKIYTEEQLEKIRTVNCFWDHAPKTEWLESFFDLEDLFFTQHSLGGHSFIYFKRFLRDAELIDDNRITRFAELVEKINWSSITALGLIMTNLVYNNFQFEWYVRNLAVGRNYSINEMRELLYEANLAERAVNSVIFAFKRIATTPLGTTLNFAQLEGRDIIIRNYCKLDDDRVLLYAIYKFFEKLNTYEKFNTEFNLSFLIDKTIKRKIPSPLEIFGPLNIDSKYGIRSRLQGLSAVYPNFINVTFTNNLQTIILRDKNSRDVLKLFQKD